jgi:soluble lytic murein transglycosylase-like protein
MRDQDNLREFFSKHAAQTFSSEIQSFARNILIGAVLLSGAAFIINLGVTNIIRSSAISGTQLPIAINLIPESTEHKTSEVAFCRAKAETLARRYFFSNNQFKESFASQLATTYKIAPKDAKIIISAAAKTSKDHDIDPFLVLGIIAKESSFNKSARSGYGATGLMQVHAPSHKKVLKTMGLDANNLKTTEKMLTSEIQINVKAGVQIYKQYEKQYGSRVKALQAYNGAKNDTAAKYAKNVLALRDGFSAQAAAPMGCDKAGYASVDHDKQKLASMQQKRNPA